MTIPSDRPKYQQVADQIEAEIRDGKWDGGKMPGVRGIADRYGVSIVTASRALQVLRDKGLIRSVERSGTYRLAAPTAERWAVVLRVTPGPLAGAVRSLVRGGFEAAARREPMHLHFDAFPDDLANPAAAAAAARDGGIRGLFLLPSRASTADAEGDVALLAGCRAAGLPVVLVERNLRGQDGAAAVDLVTMDDVAGAAECTRHLMAGGRARVAVVVASPTSTHNDRVAGYLYALHAARTAGHRPADPPELVIRLADELPSAAAARDLADRVTRGRIDGVVCYQDYAAIGLIQELLARGVRVPEDVAVCGFDGIDTGTAFAPGLTTYEYPAAGMAEHAVRLMRARLADSTRPPVRVVVPGRLVVRGSTRGQWVVSSHQ